MVLSQAGRGDQRPLVPLGLGAAGVYVADLGTDRCRLAASLSGGLLGLPCRDRVPRRGVMMGGWVAGHGGLEARAPMGGRRLGFGDHADRDRLLRGKRSELVAPLAGSD
jgi:hypothetical protein